MSWYWLSNNTSAEAIEILKENLDKVNWNQLSGNPAAIEILKDNLDNYSFKLNPNEFRWQCLLKIYNNANILNIISHKLAEQLKRKILPLLRHKNCINWRNLSENPAPGAIEILKNNFDKIDWDMLSGNPAPGAIEILKNNLNKVNWGFLSQNTAAIEILKNNLNKVNWSMLSLNPEAVELLKNNLDKVNWLYLSQNPSIGAIEILKDNLDKVHWNFLSENPAVLSENPAVLSKNPAATDLLEDNLDKVHWNDLYLSSKPNIIYLFADLDYQQMKANWSPLAEELASYVFNPSRMLRFSEKYGFDFIDINDIY